MWPSGKSFFGRSSKNRDKEEKEPGNRKVKTVPSTPPTRPVERPLIPANKLVSVPAHLRSSPPAREITKKECETEFCEGLGYSGSAHRRVRSDSGSPSPLHSHRTAGYRQDGTASAPPRITITTERSVVVEEGSSGTLTGDHSEDEYYYEGDEKMSLKSLIHPPPGFEGQPKKTASIEEDFAMLPNATGEAFMGLFHSQPASIKTRIQTELDEQREDYYTRYQEFPHADRTADIRLLESCPSPTPSTTSETETTNRSEIQTGLTTSQYHAAKRLLHRKQSDWQLRKNMLLDSPTHKLYLEDLRKKHMHPSDRDNCLEFFILNLLASEGGEVGWSQQIVRQRKQNVEHGVRCREEREEDGRGVLYSISGPAVRRRKLGEAEEKLGIRGVHLDLNGDGRRLFKRTSLRPELRVRRGRTESMAVTVGGTPERDYSTLDTIGLGHLSAKQLAGFGLDSPLSEASERDDAHVDALRFALGAGLSHLHQHQQYQPESPARTAIQDFATASTSSSQPKKENTSILPLKDPRRQTKNWEPISTTDQHQESLDRDHQKSRRDSRDERWGSDSESDGDDSDDSGSQDEYEMMDARERLSDEEIEEARRIVEDAKAKKRKKMENKGELDLELDLEKEKGKDKTSIEKSFPGRSFF